MRASDMIDTPETALRNIVRAWEALPGDSYYHPKRVERWMHDEMKPAIDRARVVLDQFREESGAVHSAIVSREQP